MIKVDQLTKKFGTFTAVNNISFSVEGGGVVGFLGPNGAGKSTTMRMITGYLQPTSGTVKVNDVSVKENPEIVKSFIGYLPEATPVYKDMTVHGFLKFVAAIRNVNDVKQSIDRVVELCHLNKVFRKPVDTLSKGYTQRVCLAQALIHDPKCLILDEPTDGLDPIQKSEIQELIKEMGKTKTILISTHMLDEVEDYCSKIIIISEGRIKTKGSLNEIKKLSSDSDTLILEVTKKDAELFKVFLNEKLSGYLLKTAFKQIGENIQFRLFPDSEIHRLQIIKDIFHYLDEKNIPFSDFRYDKGSLSNAFRNVAVSNNIKQIK